MLNCNISHISLVFGCEREQTFKNFYSGLILVSPHRREAQQQSTSDGGGGGQWRVRELHLANQMTKVELLSKVPLYQHTTLQAFGLLPGGRTELSCEAKKLNQIQVNTVSWLFLSFFLFFLV